MPAPAHPKIYHILHVDRLPSVLASGGLFSDARLAGRAPGTTIGMGGIKAMRMGRAVTCYPGTCVGDYVPFYLCSRSYMLYVIYMANHPSLEYRGGQEPIIHLEADMRRVVAHADAEPRRWAFSLGNAAAGYAEFRDSLDDLDEINWAAVEARDFRPPDIKEGKQAEFLLHDFFDWSLVDRIGVRNREIAQRVSDALTGARHRPPVEIRADWYY